MSKKKAFDGRGSSRNPFDSDSDNGERQQRPVRASSVSTPTFVVDQRASLFRDGSKERNGHQFGFASLSTARSHYKNDFRDTGGMEGQSVQELEGYAAYKAEKTMQRVHGCVKIVKEIRGTASKTLVTVHQQGQHIRRTQATTVDIDQDLSRGEKLLGDLGGLFSKKWKPKKNGAIRGSMLTRGETWTMASVLCYL